MKIKRGDLKIQFGIVEHGEVIEYNTKYYIKIKYIETCDNYRFNVVDLENGQLDFIEDGMYVTRVDAELYINFTGGIK